MALFILQGITVVFPQFPDGPIMVSFLQCALFSLWLGSSCVAPQMFWGSFCLVMSPNFISTANTIAGIFCLFVRCARLCINPTSHSSRPFTPPSPPRIKYSELITIISCAIVLGMFGNTKPDFPVFDVLPALEVWLGIETIVLLYKWQGEKWEYRLEKCSQMTFSARYSYFGVFSLQ